MDEKPDPAEVGHSPKHGKDSIAIGEWIIEINSPYGFVVRNRTGPHEYHFSAHSIGWATARYRPGASNCKVRTFAASGESSAIPELMDKESLGIKIRFAELKIKRKEGTLNPEEKEELLSMI